MIAFDKYIGEPIVLVSNSFNSLEEVSGIRVDGARLFKFQAKWVLVRTLTTDDLKDEDYWLWLDSMWSHDENHLKSFLRNKKEYQHHEATKHKATAKIAQLRDTKSRD